MINENPILIGQVNNKILSKISTIKRQQVINKIKNDIPPNITSVIEDLTSRNIDIQKANAIIDEEAKKRVESKPKTRFSLTEEQERRQILIQIRKTIVEKADEIYIKDPEKTILQIQKLCGGEIEQSIGDVVRNLIARKDYDTAKDICNKYLKQSKDEEIDKYIKNIKRLKNEIRYSEISDIVMKAINMKGTEKEEKEYIELIEKGLNMGNVELSAISLGKSKDGVKNITLKDIWIDESKLR